MGSVRVRRLADADVSAPSEKRLRRLFDALFTTYDERWSKYFGDAVLSYRMDMRETIASVSVATKKPMLT